MPAHSLKTYLAGLGLALLPFASAQAAGSPEGIWLNDTGRGAIEIKQCGDTLCGHVVWLRDVTDVKGCGRQIIGEARQAGGKTWDGGWIYSPEKKRKYDVELTPLDSGKLRVKGYAGTKLFSRTMIWTPAPADLKRCGEPAISAEAKPVAPTSETPAPVVTAPVSKPVAAVETSKEQQAPAPATAETKAPPPPASQTEDEAVAARETEDTPPAGTAEAEVADDEASDEVGEERGDKLGRLADRLAELERETGYGLKKTENGDCRLKVPFATVRFRCDD